LFTTTALAAGIAAAMMAPAAAQPATQPAAISDDIVRLGLILDMSGVYADVTGKGSARPPKWRSPTSAARCWARRST